MRINLMRYWIGVLLILCWVSAAQAQFYDPFQPSLSLHESGGVTLRLRVIFPVPERHILYADTVRVEALHGAALAPVQVPEGKIKFDPFSEEDRAVFTSSTAMLFDVSFAEDATSLTVRLLYQGCDDSLCYPPVSDVYHLSLSGEVEPAVVVEESESAPAEPADWQELADAFIVTGYRGGIMEPESFMMFLDESREGKSADAGSILEEAGFFWRILLVLLGGFLLNLTPCVLPMIPINLAIIGAGAQSSSKGKGFALGGVYGLGMAIAYGALGIFVVVAGGRFGTLNSNPWFNFGIALVFLILALAMFDVFAIDFTRFRGGRSGKAKGSFPLAFFMGVLAALLAGACVAPVVLSVLLLAGKFYAEGQAAMALMLPLLLGVGMALPWPFAGAGLSFLPRPGKWMNLVKYAFGVFILAMAAYYVYTGVQLKESRAEGEEALEVAEAQEERIKEGGWQVHLAPALARAQAEGKPVFIDFWATWCKNCLVMDKTTFADKAVVEKLDAFVKVKYQAERFDAPQTRAVLDYFDVKALPTYVVLVPAP